MADLRIGTFLAPNIMPVYQAVTDAIAARLGITADLVVETSYDSCLEDLNDICFVCSLPYVEFERQGRVPAVPVAAPVLSQSRYQGRPIYFSDVIVPATSDTAAFLDLRGKTWSVNEPLSHSGYGITRYHLVQLGEIDGFFGNVIEAGFHEASIELVRRGEIDGSAIDSQVLGVALRDDPTLRQEIRIVDSLGPSTIQPVAVSKRIEGELRQQIVDVLIEMHENPSARRGLDHGLVDRFVSVGPAAYDDIRMMVEACEAAGFTVLR